MESRRGDGEDVFGGEVWNSRDKGAKGEAEEDIDRIVDWFGQRLNGEGRGRRLGAQSAIVGDCFGEKERAQCEEEGLESVIINYWTFREGASKTYVERLTIVAAVLFLGAIVVSWWWFMGFHEATFQKATS